MVDDKEYVYVVITKESESDDCDVQVVGAYKTEDDALDALNKICDEEIERFEEWNRMTPRYENRYGLFAEFGAFDYSFTLQIQRVELHCRPANYS